MLGFLTNIGFGLADFINKTCDPFPEFTRMFLPPNPNIFLHEKAKEFGLIINRDFLAGPGLLQYNRAQAWEPKDIGDQALHQGIMAATYAVRFAVTQDPFHSVDACDVTKGLMYQQRNGKLIRGIDAQDQETFADDASPDSAGGHLLGLYFAGKYGPPMAAVQTIGLMESLADELMTNKYTLVNQDGSSTKYGKLINGLFTDPQRGSLCMAIFKAASVMTGNRKYRDEFYKLYKKHGNLLRFAAFKFLDYTKSHEMHRSAIHLTILADCAYGEDNELMERCVGGLQRIWKLSRKWRDPWIAALVNRHWKISPSDMREVVLRLHEYPSGGKLGCTERVNSRRLQFWNEREVEFKTVNKRIRATQPLPYWALPSQDFWPSRHPYMCDGFEGSGDTFPRHPPLDFLAPYWLLRQQGVIRAED